MQAIFQSLFAGLAGLGMALAPWVAVAQSPTKSLMRFPHASAAAIVFVARGELWQVPRTGGEAAPLTRDGGRKLMPRYSPDGRWIAFTARHQRNQNVYVMPATGGAPRRLTWYPNEGRQQDEMVVTWTPDSQHIVFSSHRMARQGVGQYRLFKVPVAGGLATPLPLESPGLASFGASADELIYTDAFRDFDSRKRYRGGMAQDIRTLDLRTGQGRRLTDWVGTDTAPMWAGGKLYFLSDRGAEGRANLWVRAPARGTAKPVFRQLTHFKDMDIDFPSLGAQTITFQRGGVLYAMDLADERPREVAVTLPGDDFLPRAQDVPLQGSIRATDNLHQPDFAFSPSGAEAVFAARGDLFRVSAAGSENLTQSAHADEDHPAWSPDGRLLAYTTDAGGEQQLALRPASGGAETVLTRFDAGYLYTPVWSPDSAMLALPDGQRRLWLVRRDGSAPVLVARDAQGFITDAAFSPDGRWLAFSTHRDNQLRAIHLYELASGRTHTVSTPMNSDWNPRFSADGQALFFISRRHEYPVMSDSESNFGTLKSEGLYRMRLGLGLGPDLDGLAQRVVPVPVDAGRFQQLEVAGNSLFYRRQPMAWTDGELPGEAATLHTFDLATQREKTLVRGVQHFAVSPDGQRVLYSHGEAWAVTAAATADAAENPGTGLATARMHSLIDPKSEWPVMFHQAWRLDRDMFVNPLLGGGAAWLAVRDRYARLLPLLGSRDDLNWLLGEMHGELASSHTFVGGGAYQDTGARVPVPLLGVNFGQDAAAGCYRFARIHAGDNSREDLRSPLREPGLDVKEGDCLIAVNGQAVDTSADPYRAFAGAATPLTLTIARDAGGPRRDIVVNPLDNEEALREQDAIEHRRRQVDRLSQGRIGYVYLSDLHSVGLQQFVRQYFPQQGKQAFIFDLRWNQGGSASQLVLERLRRLRVGAYVNRQGGVQPLPEQPAPRLQVALVNRFTTSDGDQFAHYFRQYGLGKLVGERTWGGVWGVAAPFRLMDGGIIAVPKDALYDNTGRWIIENQGVAPDVAVSPAPGEPLSGGDAQLEAAVTLLRAGLARLPPGDAPPPGFGNPAASRPRAPGTGAARR